MSQLATVPTPTTPGTLRFPNGPWLSDPHPQLAFVCEGIPIRMLQRKISKCPQSTWVFAYLFSGIYPLENPGGKPQENDLEFLDFQHRLVCLQGECTIFF